jgi:phosphoribosylaminoimidazolecarboxamide formyltransferase / IMP cyclohydrolase
MRALISVSDKSGIADLAASLHESGCEIISTGGTLDAIRAAGIPATSVSEVTGFPEILDGRVKTLHPAIHAGLLMRRDAPAHVETMREHGFEPIDIVVCNLYPFAQTVRNPATQLAEALEQIDIGGPAMIRASAKNFPSVIVLVEPTDYAAVAASIRAGGPDSIPLATRRALAAKAFAHVSAYDAIIAEYLAEERFPNHLVFSGRKLHNLRYGENPHQQAALYARAGVGHEDANAGWDQRLGPALSYNNVLDAAAAWQVVGDFPGPAAAIIKHNVPCGVAQGSSISQAFEGALAGDPVSAFGGVVAVNRPVSMDLAERIARDRYDVLIAPAYNDGSISILGRKQNLRCLQVSGSHTVTVPEVRVLPHALLVQDADTIQPAPESWQVMTERDPSEDEIAQLVFAWRVVRHVRSNAIVLASDFGTVGIGGGQPNRVDAVRIAVQRAGDRANGSVLASDAFFPFPDGVEAAAAAGVRAIAQPGGSRRDHEVILAAERAGIAMVFTGIRHFRH